jgi:DNA-binding transcriptional ArsR family regulator/ribosomal protein S19E (S16A)
MHTAFTPNVAPIAALIGDPARAAMLMALMGGRALTVSELGAVAGLTKATASAHLSQLEGAGLLIARKSGRHKYLALAGPDVAGLIEALMAVAHSLAVPPARPVRIGPRDPAMRAARLCYDHLAGARGVQVFDHLAGHGHLTQTAQGLDLTAKGAAFLTQLGVALPTAASRRTPACRACLDWSERKTHLAGPVGRALLVAIEAQGWLIRQPGNRALTVTAKGAAAFAHAFPVNSPG